ncbi:T9SS type A sorting domain-containing protein [Bacteroidota bacterium]
MGIKWKRTVGRQFRYEQKCPVRIGLDNDWQTLSAGLINTYAIKADGSLWAWGNNISGQLGNQDVNSINYPIQIGTDKDWKTVSAGGYFVVALKSDNSVWGWGYNQFGQVGINADDEIVWEPTRIGQDNDWLSISTGYEFSLAVKTDGSLWGWGFNGNSQVGKPGEQIYTSPVKISDATGWASVVCGSGYALAMKNDGALWGWGFNGNYQLGTDASTQIDEPQMISSENDWFTITAAKGVPYGDAVYGSHTLALKNDKSVICGTGSNYVGQLGDDTYLNRMEFVCDIGDLTTFVDFRGESENHFSITPNPTATDFFIHFKLETDSYVNILLYDEQMNLVNTLLNTRLNAGEQKFRYSPGLVPSGVYFISLRINESIYYGKMIIMR